MIVYRISNERYKNDLSGNGAALYGSRWNSPGRRMLYTSEYISLSILESLVHLDKNFIPDKQYLLHINIPDSKDIKTISRASVKKDWRTNIDYTKWVGDQFIRSGEAFELKLPSVVVEQENNFLFNPAHADFKKVKILNVELLQLDQRLFHQQSIRTHNRP